VEIGKPADRYARAMLAHFVQHTSLLETLTFCIIAKREVQELSNSTLLMKEKPSSC
jgi:hypothetical protein